MSKDIKKYSFPDPLAPDEEKIKDDYGLAWAKAIEHEWFYRPETGGECSFYDRRSKFHLLRLYARGEQPVDEYKKLLGVDGDGRSFTNYDWRPLKIAHKFVKLLTNQMSERLFDVSAEAVDKYSTDLKDKRREYLEDLMHSKDLIPLAQETMGVDITPPGMGSVPESKEEIDLHMKLNYKPAIEIATEEAIKYTFDLNNYDETQSRVMEDLVVLGLGAVKQYTDPDKGIMIKYVDVADMVHAYPTNRNFKDVSYFGELKRMSITELKRISRGKFSDDDLKKMVKSNTELNYNQISNQNWYRDDDIENTMVDVLHFTFKSINTITYKKKYHSNGGYNFKRRESTFKKKDPSYKGYDAVRKNIEVWYEGSLVLGTNYIFNYKLCENMIRPKGNLSKTVPSYVMYSPDLYQNRYVSIVGNMKQYIDQMQVVHIKIQQLIAKMRPNGIYVDIDGLSEVDYGDGNFLTPMVISKIYDETGNVFGSSLTAEGTYNNGRIPIQELRNSHAQGLPELVSTYNQYLNQLRDAIGMAPGVDASTPHPDTPVAVQNQLALNSNTATRHILTGMLEITSELSLGLSLRLKDIFKYSNLKEAYIQAIGKINVKVLESLKKYHLHDFGIRISMKPDAQEKQNLEANIQRALQSQTITLPDAIDIREVGNIKLANQLLKIRISKRQQQQREHEKEMIKTNAEAQQQSAQLSAQMKMQEQQAEAQADLAKIQAKTQGDIMVIKAEEESKSRLMEKEFNYNMQLRGIDVNGMIQKESMKEDRKDQRQDRQNTQVSKIQEQKATGGPALNFESSEDNISGSIEMGELGPQ